VEGTLAAAPCEQVAKSFAKLLGLMLNWRA